jgi:opacity protein-like surface antigen
MSSLRLSGRKATVLLAALALASPLAAQTSTKPATTESSPPKWQFELTPYLWMAGISGTIGIGNLPSQAVSASFGDILSHLTFAIMGTGEVRHGRFGVLADAVYMNLYQNDTTAPPGFSGTDVNVKQGLYTFGATFRATRGRIPLDVVAGGRYANLTSTISLASATPPPAPRSGSASEGWWAPFVGLRVLLPLSRKWELVGYGDFGGFDGYANTQWQLLGGINFKISKLLVAKAGYRYIDVEYIKNELKQDLAYGGFYLGAGFRF